MDRNKSLLIYSGWLGDFIWIVPTIKALRKQFKNLSIVVSDVQAPLALGLEGTLLDKVFVGTRRDRTAAARRIRQAAVGAGTGTFIDIKGRGKAGLFIPWRRDIAVFMPGRRDAREYLLARLLHPFAETLPARDTNGHMVDSYLGIARVFGAAETAVDFKLPFAELIVAEADKIVEQEGLRTGRTIAINPGSAQFSKIWPARNYRALADILHGDMGCKVVIMGARNFEPNGNYDLEVSRRYFSDGKFLNLVERTGLLVDSCLFQSGVFDVAVGNDSFAGHMAGSASQVPAGTPDAAVSPDGRHFTANLTVSLFGPTNPRFCRPYDPTGEFNSIVQPDRYPDDCPYDRADHVCPHYGDKACVGGNHCMTGITVTQVVSAIERQLERARRRTESRQPRARNEITSPKSMTSA